MRFGVVVFPGTWSDCDFHYVVSEVLHQPVRYVWHRERDLSELDCVILPGGFSYGDYLRAGAVAGRSPVVEALREFVGRGGLVLGSCNGFQILCEAHLLPGALTRNTGLHFVNRDTKIRIESNRTQWTTGYTRGQVITVVLKSGVGAYVADQATLAQLAAADCVIARYAGESPNGSADDIAGIASEQGNVVGLMPHPEHAIDALTGPGSDGLGFFTSILATARRHQTAQAAGA